MLRDYGIGAIVVATFERDRYRSLLPDLRTFDVGEERHPRSRLVTDHLADLPAYAIFTSGATGKPKGVVASHRNLVHVVNTRRVYHGEPPGNVLLTASLAFDASAGALFWTLGEGGTLDPSEGRRAARSCPARVARGRGRGRTALGSSEPLCGYARLGPARRGGSAANDRDRRRALQACARRSARARAARSREALERLRPDRDERVEQRLGSARTPCVGGSPIGVPIANVRIYPLDARASRRRSVCPASRSSRGNVTRGYRAMPRRPPIASCPTRSRLRPARGCTARATSRAGAATQSSSTSAAPTIRSSSAAFASSSPRLRRSSSATKRAPGGGRDARAGR